MTETPDMALRAVQAELIEAIHGQRVAAAAQDILDRPGTHGAPAAAEAAERALQCCKAISAQVRALRHEALTALGAAGVQAKAQPGPEDQDASQIHLTTLRVPPADLAHCVAALEPLGFRAPIPLTPGRLRVLRRTTAALRLVRFDGVSARVDLRFAARPATRAPRALRPRPADLMVADLPARAAWAYWALRPLRIVRDRLGGRAQEISEGGLLGTPDDLIGPILAALDVQPETRFVDLGCGDGRLVAAAAQQGAHATGYEIDSALAEAAREMCDSRGLGARAAIITGRAETADLSGATAVFLFVPSYLLARLLPAVRRKAPAGATLLVHEQTRIPWGQPPDQSLPVFGAAAMTVVHLWRV